MNPVGRLLEAEPRAPWNIGVGFAAAFMNSIVEFEMVCHPRMSWVMVVLTWDTPPGAC